MPTLRGWVALLAAALLAGCNAPDDSAWPVELDLPANAIPAALPPMLRTGEYGQPVKGNTELVPNQQSGTWARSFNYAPGWDSIAAHVDKQLRGAGYQVHTKHGYGDWQVPGVPEDQIIRIYRSGDNRYEAVLANSAYMRNHGVQGFEGAADYIITIDRR